MQEKQGSDLQKGRGGGREERGSQYWEGQMGAIEGLACSISLPGVGVQTITLQSIKRSIHILCIFVRRWCFTKTSF